MMRRPVTALALGLMLAGMAPAAPQASPSPCAGCVDATEPPPAQDARQQPLATFKSAVEVVTVTASVRDGRGRVIRDLKKADFEVLDTGIPRQIKDFYAGDSPVSLAVLLDISGSMSVGGNMDRAREAVAVAMMNLKTGSDEAALFTFDSQLQEVIGFTKDLDRVRRV